MKKEQFESLGLEFRIKNGVLYDTIFQRVFIIEYFKNNESLAAAVGKD